MKIHYRHYQSVYVMVWYVEKYLFELENKRREREREKKSYVQRSCQNIEINHKIDRLQLTNYILISICGK